MHFKRQRAPKNWPLHRKGTAYVVRPLSNIKLGVPILILLRDMLKLTQNKKETKRVLHEGLVLLNHKKIKEEKNPALLFDVITIIPSKKNYRLTLSEKGKFICEEINEKESNEKVSKVINKRVLKGKKIQLNLLDGRNYVSDISCKSNDSILINLKTGKIEKCLQFKEGVKVLTFKGKHSGKIGIIEKINNEKKIVELKLEDKSKINVLIKYLIVTN